MKTILQRIFLVNWHRKATSLFLAVIIWLVVNQTLTVSKTFSNIPVKIVNIPKGKTVQGLQGNGLLKRRMTITLVGNKTLIEEMTPNDFEVVIDSSDKLEEWNPVITAKNLVSLNPEIDLGNALSKVYHQPFSIRLVKLITEKIPVLITKPIGDAPRDYLFLDVWPYELNLTLTGPEDVIKRIKAKEIRLNFNLNDISKAQLDTLPANEKEDDVVSYFVPQSWKQLTLPLISDSPIEINDAQAKNLRIDFVRCNVFPVEDPIPAHLYFPQEFLHFLNPQTCKLASDNVLKLNNGIYFTNMPLYVKGVSHLFLKTVRDMFEISIIASPNPDNEYLDWSIAFINPRFLEDQYVAALADSPAEDSSLQASFREEYLRNRFRNYMHRFQLYNKNGSKFILKPEMDGNLIQVKE